jgi:hypothetical protein
MAREHALVNHFLLTSCKAPVITGFLLSSSTRSLTGWLMSIRTREKVLSVNQGNLPMHPIAASASLGC